MKAMGYTRVSTQEQAKEGLSLEMQAHKIVRYADLHEMDLLEIISDEV
jgi:DNA invertase Pin-like site-specific DNA recombinase